VALSAGPRERKGAADVPQLWLAEKGTKPLSPNGIELMIKLRGKAASVVNAHAHLHRWWHNVAHERHKAGGNTGDLMLILGWAPEDMPRRYGSSASAERAQDLQVRMVIGENV